MIFKMLYLKFLFEVRPATKAFAQLLERASAKYFLLWAKKAFYIFFFIFGSLLLVHTPNVFFLLASRGFNIKAVITNIA